MMNPFQPHRFLKYGFQITILVVVISLLAACSSGIRSWIQPDNPLPAAANIPAAAVQSSSSEQGFLPVTSQGQTTAGETYQVMMTDDAYQPNELIIPLGSTVVWTNMGQPAHTVTADDGTFASDSLQNGETFQYTFAQPGVFVYHCTVHGGAGGQGMTGAVTVYSGLPPNAGSTRGAPVMATAGAASALAAPEVAPNGVTRVYYIGAVEVEWDFAPSNQNDITGQPFDEVANVFVQHGATTIGKVYTKAVYREFTDDTFSVQKPISPEWQHLGTLGPVIHAEVGDEILVYFKNMTSITASMHPHGVFYEKDSEGAGYNDGTSGNDKADDGVLPDGTHTYHWLVPERAGPGPMETSSVMWMYHSHVDEPGDTNAGLMGAIIVTARGKANPDGTPRDVDREFVTMFSVIDENASPYLQHNIDTKTDNPAEVNPEDEAFEESNLMHSINGYVYGNLPGLTMKLGERVRWYVMGMGTEVDLHTPHWHGNVVTVNGMHMDVVSLLPASMLVADMVPDDPGVWLLHCHVNDHIIAGMQALFTVEP